MRRLVIYCNPGVQYPLTCLGQYLHIPNALHFHRLAGEQIRIVIPGRSQALLEDGRNVYSNLSLMASFGSSNINTFAIPPGFTPRTSLRSRHSTQLSYLHNHHTQNQMSANTRATSAIGPWLRPIITYQGASGAHFWADSSCSSQSMARRAVERKKTLSPSGIRYYSKIRDKASRRSVARQGCEHHEGAPGTCPRVLGHGS